MKLQPMLRGAAALFAALCLTAGGQAARGEEDPYFDRSAYLKPTDVFLEGEVRIDGQTDPALSGDCFAARNVCYLPLRRALTACGVADEDIVWEDGTVSVRLSAGTLELAVDSGVWTLNGVARRTRNGHARLRENVTYIPKDMLDEWKIETGDPQLARLTVNAYYTTLGGGTIQY